jgi:3-isopropylmalate/(R)-2-methylmalate dehydratase small subunit
VTHPIRTLRSRTVVLPADNIDTDQMFPGRFLTVTTRQGLGDKLFADWRFDANGRPKPEFPLNRPEARDAVVLVAGRNFGCGSSREHAVWALADHGLRVVISSQVADIFRRNAVKNGLLPIELDAESHAKLLDAPGATVEVDLEARHVRLPDGSTASFAIEPFARYCLMEGVDELEFLLAQAPAIEEHERRSPGTLVIRHGDKTR